MLGVFFESVALMPGLGSGILGALIFAFLISVFIYVFHSLLYVSLAKKAKQNSPNLAWIPVVGPWIIAFNASGMHWWPWLLIVVPMIISFIVSDPIVITIILSALGPIFLIFKTIWSWRLFGVVGRPGWWALLIFIPIVGPIVAVIVLIFAAWTDVGLVRKE